MPLSILIPMVVVGIGGVTVLLHLLGLSTPKRLADADAARDAWLREFPEDIPTNVTLANDQRAALIETRAGAGIVWTIGLDTTARPLEGALVQETAKGLRIKLPDYSAPRINLTLTEQERTLWQAPIKDTP